MPRTDLILATVGRTEEVERFLRALDAQTQRDFRLIVVDQNADDRVRAVLERYERLFPLLHLRSEPGLSRARNVALGHLEGELVAFPDDDCWYPPDLLERVARVLREHPEWDGISGRAVGEHGEVAAGYPDTEPGAMTMFNLWRRVTSYTLFLRRGVVQTVGPFDETLGVGSRTPWGSGEDLDYVARALRGGCVVSFEPALCVHHPQKREHESRPAAQEGYQYGAGFGRVLRKNRLPWWFAAYAVARSTGAAAFCLLTGRHARARFFWAVAKGRVHGLRSPRWQVEAS